MLGTLQARLEKLGLSLPPPAAPVANYVPYRLLPYKALGWGKSTGPHTRLMYTSGFVPTVDGVPLHTGKLGAEVSIEDGQACARQCVLNALGWLDKVIEGDLGRFKVVVQMRVFVACTPDFTDHPKVANGASDLLVEIFDDAGQHTRAAVGCPSLPLNVPVEIDFLFEVL
jgi:enamine deaminase RidA (YjgF/YER057c/UK114 family)